MRHTVLLFDIDGTLVTTGGAGRLALARAFQARYGVADACKFPLDGMTDRAIVRGGLAELGVPCTDAEIDAVLSAYVALLSETISAVDRDRYRVHAGMREAVDAALARKDCAVGLGTGNIRAGARAKLERVGLYDRFRFGGFGCDHEVRNELIRMGAERGAALLGAPLGECRVVVIGDTPKDIAAAQAMGAECVAVGTGHFDVSALRAAGATHAVPDLTHPGALEAVLGQA